MARSARAMLKQLDALQALAEAQRAALQAALGPPPDPATITPLDRATRREWLAQPPARRWLAVIGGTSPFDPPGPSASMTVRDLQERFQTIARLTFRRN